MPDQRITFVSPFQRLNQALAGSPPGKPVISLAVGEPQHPIPPFVAPVLAANVGDFSKYPLIRGTDQFRNSVAGWLDRRYGLDGTIDPARMVIPLNGSREGLLSAGLAIGDWYGERKKDRIVLVPNPFYPVYWVGAEVADARTVALDCVAGHNFLPDLDALKPDLLRRTIAFYLASPTNPQGSVATPRYWQRLIEMAREYDFFVFADEVYGELYRKHPPAGVLTAAAVTGSYRNVIAFQSLSKRSSLAGLRVGFAAGDPDFIDFWSTQRNISAPQVPMPAQAVAAAAYDDEKHVEDNRRLYNDKYEAAERIIGNRFGFVTPAAGFYLWLDMSQHGGGEAAAIRLWREVGLRTLPGGFLAVPRPDGSNPGDSYLRLAMVQNLDTTREALNRLTSIFD